MKKILLRLSLLLTALASGPAASDTTYPGAVKTIVEQRCMVCHGCYDAPCQLKLDAFAGAKRGASKEIVYDGTRLTAATPTRLFEDAQTIEQWRQLGFYPVLDDTSPDEGTLTRMLELKRAHPLPQSDLLPDAITLGLDRKQQCVKPGEFDKFARDYPLWGMPYGLPALDDDSHRVMTQWLASGAPGVAVEPPSPALQSAITQWETFFNGESLKERLMARYMYEHLFIGNLYFSDEQENDRYFNLVRSRTPPGEAIDIIATRRPYDDPGTTEFFYRLQPLRTALLAKRHMPYALNNARMARWRELFLAPDYTVTALPGYERQNAENPFITFRELPENARYRFMLDEAHFTIMGYIKGPVCRGQVALNVIDDHFWVVFLNPDRPTGLESAEFLAKVSGDLRLPADRERGAMVTMIEWRNYSQAQLKFLKDKFAHIKKSFGPKGMRLDMGFIWDGDGTNDNAALTIFRHNNSASVVKGFVGQQPNTAWVIDYSLLERIHYLLVAGFDVFGNIAHQLETRLYMDFLRMEGEQNFLFFLPPDHRLILRDFWYREATKEANRFVMTDSVAVDRTTGITFETDNPKRELMNMLRNRTKVANTGRYKVKDRRFDHLQGLQSAAFSYMPEVSFLEVTSAEQEPQVYTIVHNNSFANNAEVFREAQRRIPQEDYLTVTEGFVGAYPNAFFQVGDKELTQFLDAIASLQSEDDYAQLVTTYGVRRTQPGFWKVSDELNAQYRAQSPREAGIFDLNRYENR